MTTFSSVSDLVMFRWANALQVGWDSGSHTASSRHAPKSDAWTKGLSRRHLQSQPIGVEVTSTFLANHSTGCWKVAFVSRLLRVVDLTKKPKGAPGKKIDTYHVQVTVEENFSHVSIYFQTKGLKSKLFYFHQETKRSPKKKDRHVMCPGHNGENMSSK